MNSTEQSKALYDACHGSDWEAVIALCSCETKSEGTSNFNAPHQDKHGSTCLHIAVEKNAPCQVIRAILDAHKDRPVCITRLRDKYAQTALHIAAHRMSCSNNEAAVIKILVKSDPQCATTRDYRGCTPLYYIVNVYYREIDEESANRVACARALLNASTTESILLPVADYKFTALHMACFVDGISPEIVKMMLEHCPQAALAKDADGNTPLHNAVRYYFNCAKITFLLESLTRQGRSGAAVVNNDGKTPLHLAIYSANNISLKLLIDLLPDNVCTKDKDGMTPLHWVQEFYAERLHVPWHEQGMAVCSSPDFRYDFENMCKRCNLLVKAMLSVRYRHKSMTGEESLWMTTEQKRSGNEECLEHAMIHNYLRLGPECPLDISLVLMEMHPHQTRMKDARGDLPLHIALENGVQHAKPKKYRSRNRKMFGIKSNNIIKGLIDAYPQAARVPNRNGDLPFHILLQNIDGETGWYRSVQPLLGAHPAALWHERTNLLPVLLPLILAKLGDEDDLSILYEIVREMPSLCQPCLSTYV